MQALFSIFFNFFNCTCERNNFMAKVQDRLLKYVAFWTTSDEESSVTPSSEREFVLGKELEQELKSLGLERVTLTEHCYVYGLLPATPGMEDRKAIGFIAHMDTAPDYSGENVKPQIIENYDGMRECVIANSSIQENGVLIKHIPVKGGHLFWTEDISVLLDQYQDIEEQQEELTERNQLLQMTYQKEAARKKLEEQNRLLNMIQDQTYKQYELLSSYMKKLEQTESREEYDMLLSKIVVVGTYLKRRKNLVLTRYSSQGDSLTMADLKQSLAESCENLKLCRIRAAYYVQDKEKQLQADDILNCYDFFEWLIEQLFDVINSVFFRVTQIDEKLQISVHVMSSTDIHNFLKERPELLIQQEEEQEWFIRCPLS